MSLKISSEKINNPFLVDLLEKLADSFRKMDHDFFIIGATARDIIIQQMLNTSSRRKTRDLDLAIAVPNWQEFDKIKNSLIADGFEKDKAKHQRFYYGDYEIDITIVFILVGMRHLSAVAGVPDESALVAGKVERIIKKSVV